MRYTLCSDYSSQDSECFPVSPVTRSHTLLPTARAAMRDCSPLPHFTLKAKTVKGLKAYYESATEGSCVQCVV